MTNAKPVQPSVGVSVAGECVVAPGFESVADTFFKSLSDRAELGAAFAAYREGVALVDVWGGVSNSEKGESWGANTGVALFSGTKGLVAVCILLLIDRGDVDLDRTVAEYWPEFAAAGKQNVLVRDVVSHSARIPGLDTPVDWQEALDDQRMASLVAMQPQSSDPRAAFAYHALTFGWICGEVVRRVTGRSVGQFFAEEIAGPLGLDLWIGLPEARDGDVARIEVAPTWGQSPAFNTKCAARDPLLRSMFGNPPRYHSGTFPWNEGAWQRSEVPGANAIGTVRSVAQLYDKVTELLSDDTLERAQAPLSTRFDPLIESTMSFGVGFQLQTLAKPFGPALRAFGHCGSGGSCHGRWPDERVGFSYAMNLLRDDVGDTRAKSVLASLYDALRGGA